MNKSEAKTLDDFRNLELKYIKWHNLIQKHSQVNYDFDKNMIY